MYSETIARKLDKTVAQLQKEIAERKQAQEALRQSEEKFSKAFHATPDAIEITRISDERLIEVNEVFVRRTGFRMKSGEILDGLVSGETFSMGEEKYLLQKGME